MVPPVCRYNKASFWTVLAGKHDLDNPHEPGQQVRNTQTQQSSFIFSIWSTINSKPLFFSKCVDVGLTQFLSAVCGRILSPDKGIKSEQSTQAAWRFATCINLLVQVKTFTWNSMCLCCFRWRTCNTICSLIHATHDIPPQKSFIWCRPSECYSRSEISFSWQLTLKDRFTILKQVKSPYEHWTRFCLLQFVLLFILDVKRSLRVKMYSKFI